MAHPFIPYITEEIWQRVAPLAGQSGATIMTQAYPEADESKIDDKALGDVEWLKGVIVAIRNIRGEMDISPAKAIPVLLRNGNEEDQRRFKENEGFVKSLAKLESMTWLTDEEAPMSSTQLVGSMEVLVPMAGLINLDAEISRLNKEIEKANKEIGRLSGKLNNKKFVSNAPKEVVEKEQAKLADAQSSQAKLAEQLEKIKAM
jgi:valyl-tRNA synthetase